MVVIIYIYRIVESQRIGKKIRLSFGYFGIGP